jgi:WD40 repeat protein
VSFVSDDVVASGADDGSIVLTDTATGQPVGRRMEGHDGRVRAVTSAPQHGLLISGGEDGRVVLWDIDTKSRLGLSVAAFDGMVRDVEASPDGNSLVSAGPGGTVLTSTDVDVWLIEACRVAGRDLSAEEWRLYAGDAFEQEPVCGGRPTGDDE